MRSRAGLPRCAPESRPRRNRRSRPAPAASPATTRLERLHQPGDVLALLDGAHVEHDASRAAAPGRPARGCRGAPPRPCAGSTPSRSTTWLRGELRNRDDGVGARGGVARLRGEARAEFGGGILAGHHEQVVEGGDGAPQANARAAAGSARGRGRRRAARAAPPAGAGAHWPAAASRRERR